MQFNFDKINDRRNANSSKWQVKEHELPMWVADMDIQTAPAIIEAMHKDADRGIFGYQYVPDEYYQAVASWYKEEHNFEPDLDWLVFSNGVMPSIGSILRHLTDLGDNVLLQEPNYNSFFNAITSNGRHIVNSELDYQYGKYSINWKDLEKKLSDPQTTAMIVCNPHNPAGIIWDRETLTRIGKLANKYDVLIISDEIHGDVTMPGYDYVPFASLDEEVTQNSISLVSPSKTFNLAILHAATLFIPNAKLRQKVEHAISVDGISSPGIMSMDASIAAYTEGHEWLTELRQYIQKNREYVEDFAKKNIPDIKVLPAQATYLAWIDCSKLTDKSDEFNQFLRDKTGLYLAEGTKYRGNGNQFLRMNLATPKSNVEDAMQRLAKGITEYKA
ncbi:MalY/PatB family protein [Companilactobacillus pabuli]|jgi:cystathionine beta-lyase|uniref:cysteine-S-conjugate beta-lyase n=1 Tax=Companilactobacillus pabuli TaxID=2714036 RepID=A0A7L7KYY7_9LACO|nr:MalY/PatB family protein [Companilactobacillus pabuli]AKP02808.1 plastocyanin [Companilactobacillus farciminis]AKS51106.1 plastocyanin [Companilactobacillus farciminis]MDG5114258.1 pyridoxal phosphate-dependent aminotransferase [Companilactobacillus pabuli]QMT84990.1 pyridoxal phosphate-dependent aminotransferase [Companilactobacillus pabuli]